MPDRIDRRRFLAALAGGAAAALGLARPGRAGAAVSSLRSDHPDPRPGIDASKVLTADQLADAPHAVPFYDAVREMPEIADGIRCYCGCADLPGYRSLLTCYEEGGMAKHCHGCQGQARLAHRRWREGQTLEQIRRAIDARYGSRRGARSGVATAAALLGLAAFVGAPAPGSAQIRASERAMVSQTIDGTVVTVDYARPRARGRADLFGGVVKWGEVWTPGANDATVLDLGKDVEIDGHPVPAGRWSVWLVTAEEGPWELVLDPRDTLFHTQHPEPTTDQIRFPVEVEVEETGHVEVLTWSFPRVAADGTTLALAWGTTAVELDIEVEPGFQRTVDADEAAAYVGSFRARFAPPSEPGAEGEGPPSFPFTIRHDASGDLIARTLFPSAEEEPEHSDAVLIPKAEGIFLLGILRDGELFDVATEIFFEFEIEEGRAVSFLVRDATTDAVVGSGERIR